MIPESLHPCLAELVLASGAVLLLMLSCVRALRERAGDVALIVTASSSVAAVASMDAPHGVLAGGWLVTDPWSSFFKFVLSMTAMATVWMCTRSRGEPAAPAWSWAVLVVSMLGMFVMIAATNVLAAWLGLEIAGLSMAVWIACQRPHGGDGDGLVAVLLLGSAASALALLGFSLLFGLTGTLDYARLAARLPLALAAPGGRQVVQTALVLIVAGLGAGIAMVPWHAWRADLAQRVPPAVSGWCFTGGSLAGLAMLGRFSRAVLSVPAADAPWNAFPGLDWASLISVAAMATMTVGNVAALRAGDARQAVAWLSVAQTGSLMMGLAVMSDLGLQAMLFHAVACTLGVVGAMAALAPLVEEAGSADVDGLRGMARRRGVARALAGAIAVCFLSLAAAAPLAGFAGRSLLLAAVFEAGRPILAAVAAINSVLGLVCSLRIVAILLDRSPATRPRLALDFEAATLLVLLVAGTVGIGLWPGALHSFTGRSVVFFAG